MYKYYMTVSSYEIAYHKGAERLNIPSLGFDVEGVPHDSQLRLARDPNLERTEGLDVLQEPLVLHPRSDHRREGITCHCLARLYFQTKSQELRTACPHKVAR